MSRRFTEPGLFSTKETKRRRRDPETVYPYKCDKCGESVTAFLQIRGRCPCGGTYKLEER